MNFWEERESIKRNLLESGETEEVDFCFMDGTSVRDLEQEDIENLVQTLMANSILNHDMAKQVVNRYDAYCLLHGDCNIFAQYLSEKYGYGIEAVFEYENEDKDGDSLIHMYCIRTTPDGKKEYIDVRGICKSYDKFMQEFYDAGLWSNDGESRIITYKSYTEIPDKYKTSKEDLWRKQYIKLLEQDYNCYRPEAKAQA